MCNAILICLSHVAGAQFGLIVEGFGYHSFRLTEACCPLFVFVLVLLLCFFCVFLLVLPFIQLTSHHRLWQPAPSPSLLLTITSWYDFILRHIASSPSHSRPDSHTRTSSTGSRSAYASPNTACWRYDLPFPPTYDVILPPFSPRPSPSSRPHSRHVQLPAILRSIPESIKAEMQERVVFVYEQFFKSLALQVHTGMLACYGPLCCCYYVWHVGVADVHM